MPDTELPAPILNGRTLIYDGLAQTDLDMANYRLLNLDDSNLNIGETPPTVGPVLHKWLKSWNSTTRVWTTTQPAFDDISGNLTSTQQAAITQLGTITSGVWQGNQISASKLPRLNLINPPAQQLNLNQHKIINLADPVNAQDAVNLQYVNSMLPGIHVKEAVQCATTRNIVLQNTQVIDGFTVRAEQRVLVKNQTNAVLNGIYIVKAGVGVPWQRAGDSNTKPEVLQAYCFVLHGTVNNSTAWVQINDLPVGVGTDPLHYVFFSTGVLGAQGPPGPGVPPGGSALQILAKIDGTNYNTGWVTPLYQPLGSVPLGGTEGQVLVKLGADDYLTEWGDVGVPIDGETGDILVKNPAAPGGREWVTSLSQVPAGGTDGQFLKKNTGVDYVFGWETAREVPANGDAEVGFILIKDSTSDTGYNWYHSPSQVPAGTVPGQVLTFFGENDPVAYDNRWATPSPDGAVYAILQSAQLNPTGTTNTTGVMMGLGQVITPFVTGKVIVTIAGFMYNTSTGSVGAGIRIGTGTAPVNGDALTGSGYGPAAICGPLGANVRTPFSVTAAISGLTVGTAIWIDLDVLAVSPGTARVAAVTISAWEIP